MNVNGCKAPGFSGSARLRAGRRCSGWLLASLLCWTAVLGASPPQGAAGDEIPLSVGRSVVLDHPDEIQRIALTDPAIADAVPISTREILINAKAPGITTLILWSRSGDRNFFTINVGANMEQLQEHIRTTFPNDSVRLDASQGVVTVSGNVSGPEVAERVVAMVAGSGAGAVVNNLVLPPPPPDRQIVLKVKFAELQRSASREFGLNLLSTGAGNTPAVIGTQQFGSVSAATLSGSIGMPTSGYGTDFTIGDVLNIFAFRPDLNLGVLIKALQARNLIQILAEPNVITTSGKEAQFLVGGEFPVPILQGGATAGAVTIQFREFGIRLQFLPVVTARGSVKMHVRPEVSALDFANAVTFSGFLIPALSTRRIDTDVELMPGQSFVIGGLIDNRVAETVNRIPGLSSIPLLGKLFTSHNRNRNNTELVVVVTPEFPSPIEAGEPLPDIPRPSAFLEPLPGSLQGQQP